VTKTDFDLWVLSLEDRKATLLLGTEFQEELGSFSPDGRWIAYISTESGRNEVYVRPFVASGPSAGPSLGDGKWQISKDGAAPALPRWRGDGKELFFAGIGDLAMAVDVNGSGAGFQTGTPHVLFSLPGAKGADVTADGKRFPANVPVAQSQQAAHAPITVVLNWQADLRK
jgi:Tol biopolymer transport system component